MLILMYLETVRSSEDPYLTKLHCPCLDHPCCQRPRMNPPQVLTFLTGKLCKLCHFFREVAIINCFFLRNPASPTPGPLPAAMRRTPT
jgi:hypothetical protein